MKKKQKKTRLNNKKNRDYHTIMVQSFNMEQSRTRKRKKNEGKKNNIERSDKVQTEEAYFRGCYKLCVSRSYRNSFREERKTLAKVLEMM